MIAFPCCKINLGLNIIDKRPDGYHNIETVFYPVPLCDVLEVCKMDREFPSLAHCDLKITGNQIEGNEQNNLVVRAYNLIANDYNLPRIHIHLFKKIPTQAGLGGGSSDAAHMIKLLDEKFHLNMGNAEMENYASKLGADCAFFIRSEISFATGIGDELVPAMTEEGSLEGYYLVIIKPDISISTAEAYAHVKPQIPQKSCREIIQQPIDSWKNELKNDFEEGIFTLYPLLADIKQKLYNHGALYAQMSGSGSSLFGIFGRKPINIEADFEGMFTYTTRL